MEGVDGGGRGWMEGGWRRLGGGLDGGLDGGSGDGGGGDRWTA